MTPWSTDTFLLVLAVVALVLSLVAYISSKLAQKVVPAPEPRDLQLEAKQLREVAARAYRSQIRRVR